MRRALASSPQTVETTRVRLSGSPPVRLPPLPGSLARPVVLDPWLEFEAVIDRLARLVIHAQTR